MHQLRNDYSEGAHPRILDALVRTNLEQTVGYGADEHCARRSSSGPRSASRMRT